MAPRKTSILVVDDDVHILRLMHRILGLEGYRVLRVAGGPAALDAFADETPDLVLLDVMMPTMDGYEVCRHIRDFSAVPIIMVTARGNDDEKVRGLDAGADDYLTKPFSSRELMARVRAALRRSVLAAGQVEPVFESHGLRVDFAWHRAFLNGRDLDLTATEVRLLGYLARNAGRVATPDQILTEVWGEGYIGEHHLLRVNIARLRLKLEDDAREPRFIVTRTGIGYMLPGPAESAASCDAGVGWGPTTT